MYRHSESSWYQMAKSGGSMDDDISPPPTFRESSTPTKKGKKKFPALTKTKLKPGPPQSLGQDQGLNAKQMNRRKGSNPLFVLDDVRKLRSNSLRTDDNFDSEPAEIFDDEPRFKSEGYRPRPVFNKAPMPRKSSEGLGTKKEIFDDEPRFKSEGYRPRPVFNKAPMPRKSSEGLGTKKASYMGKEFDDSNSSKYLFENSKKPLKQKWTQSSPAQLPDKPRPGNLPTSTPPGPPAAHLATPPPAPPPPPPPTVPLNHPTNVPPKALLDEIRHRSKGSPDDAGNYEGGDNNPSYELAPPEPESGISGEDVSFGGLSAPPEILARGPRARRAYAEAAQAGTKKVFRTRLMLVGQERVGKTSLKKTLTGQGFDQNEAITDGVETTNACEINIQVAKAGGKLWSIHKKGHGNEDAKEGEYSKALADEIAKRLIVTPPQDQDSLAPHRDATDGRGLNPEEAAAFISDDVEAPTAGVEDVSTNMPNQIASLVEKMLKEQLRMKEVGRDSTDGGKDEGVSLSIWDFAGHDIYYTTHQVFLTWRAIYVVVFDLSRSLDSVVPPESRDDYYEMAKGGAKAELTCLEFINFWLCSIFAHAVAPSSIMNKNASKTSQKSPPIFIVGTHRASVTGDTKEKNKKIDAAFEKIRKTIKKKPFECHVVPKYYAIENSLEDKDEELIALRRHIEKVAMDEPYMGEEIPLRWLLFEEALAADKINYMSLDQTKELTRPVGMESDRELLTMLTFYHDLGYIVYYGGIDDQESLLRDIVILNPQWLIDVFKQVISILDPKERDGIVSDAWTTLEDDGILEDRLIRHMWKGFLEQKEALVQLMAKFDLICEAPVEQLQPEEELEKGDVEVSDDTERNMKKRYYVPSRLSSRCSPEEIGQIKSSTDFYVDFRGFLPDGLFHRLMTRAVRWMTEKDGESVILFYRQISLMVDDEHHALLEMLPPHQATIKVTVFQAAVADPDDESDNYQPPSPSAVKDVMDFVTRTLDNLRQHWAKRIQYDICFLCPKCSKRKLFQDCFKRKSLQCGLHRIPTNSVKSKFGITEEGVDSGTESPMMSRRSTCKESRVLCDRYFSDLARNIGFEWHSLGIRLGLNQADIDHIKEDNLNAVDRIIAMLRLWKQRSSCRGNGRQMIEDLCLALKNCDREDLVDDIREAAGLR
ncbi:uncharacterized protein LOC121420992 isoform X3 [Lytechinus variegatus]|uniref:uncharacterized protein LOC121420992 isoform X3 n=1 Tax=Lytechinus variegatus TaxID=7654 RepID=UPI001BB2B1C9|nr:uncharacterized protein LOC121420992 isoform X3 [Lytechinus variegatus]